MAKAYPLAWPDHWPRTKNRGRAQFRTTLNGAINNVQEELRRFAKDSGRKVSNIVISSNFTLGATNPEDPGVACYFTWDDLPTCIAVDRYDRLEHNLQAIFHCLEAERTKLRHGGLNLVRAAFRGYAALPGPIANGRPWHEVLGVEASLERECVERRYKLLRSQFHPDRKGGDARRFQEVQRAWDEYRALES